MQPNTQVNILQAQTIMASPLSKGSQAIDMKTYGIRTQAYKDIKFQNIRTSQKLT